MNSGAVTVAKSKPMAWVPSEAGVEATAAFAITGVLCRVTLGRLAIMGCATLRAKGVIAAGGVGGV